MGTHDETFRRPLRNDSRSSDREKMRRPSLRFGMMMETLKNLRFKQLLRGSGRMVPVVF